MSKLTFAACLISSSLVFSPVFASNFFKESAIPSKIEKASQTMPQEKSGKIAKNYTNFSGTWSGTCTNGATKNVVISNTDTHFTVGGVTYGIEALDTIASTKDDETNFFHIWLRWTSDKTILLYQDVSADFYPLNGGHAGNFVYEKGSVALENDQIIFKKTIHASHIDEEFVCTYYRVG